MSKFLTFEDRLTIEKGLRENQSFGAIAKELHKDRTTIAKEIKKYAFDLKSGYSSYPYNACAHRVTCKQKKICGSECTRQNSQVKCSCCNKCNDRCADFLEETCQGRFKPPYVCNACSQYGKCTLKSIFTMRRMHIYTSLKIFLRVEQESWLLKLIYFASMQSLHRLLSRGSLYIRSM